jgi:hypothetical protein
MSHPYLWQTVLWIDRSGEFKCWPEPNAVLLHALKQGVVGRHADEIVVPNVAGGGARRVDAAAAFLSVVIRYTRGWLYQNRPELFRRRRPIWFINVGLPAANFDDNALVSTYRRVAAAALLLANLEGAVTVERTRLFLAEGQVVDAGRSATEAEKLGVAAIPETAAEVAGFAKSTNRASGLYLMVDVGAMTLDVCAFRLEQGRAGRDLYAPLTAQVRPLGVDAYHWFRGQGKTEAAFVRQCERCLWEVVWGTKRARDPHADCWKGGNDLPVFLAGGGARNDLHRRIVEELRPWLRLHAHNDGIRLLELPIPPYIDLPVAIPDFARLAVAWGLSYPPSEIGEVLPSSALDDILPAKPADLTDRFVSKDVV